MKITTVDIKRRLVLPGAQPGETYAVRETSPGHYEIAKLITAPHPKPTPAPHPKPTPEKLDALLASAALTPKISSGKLRAFNREP